MRETKLKSLLLWIVFLLPITWCGAKSLNYFDGYSHINIKEADVQGVPKSSSIDASINGHTLSIVFLENLGQVVIEVSYAGGGEIETSVTYTPNGVNYYIPNTGSYVVTFTLSNGDVYYGEFEVTD